MADHNNNFNIHNEAVESLWGGVDSFSVGKISSGLLCKLAELLNRSNEEVTKENNMTAYNEDLLLSNLEKDIYDKLHSITIPHKIDMCDEMTHQIICNLHDELREIFSSKICSPFIFINTRSWTTKPGSEKFGPNAPHYDGFEPGHLKIMVYLTPLDAAAGYLEIDQAEIKNLPAGTCVLFKNSDILHCGVPGRSQPRTVIEVTIMRSFVDMPQIWQSHHDGRHLLDPIVAYDRYRQIKSLKNKHRTYYALSKNIINEKLSFLNIGSGKRNWDGWVCLDEIEYLGVTTLSFTDKMVFPIDTDSINLAYSSHNFEHLSNGQIQRVLSETKRVMAPHAKFLLKIPDFEWFINEYRRGNFMATEGKGIESVVHTWVNKGVADNFSNRTAMMFCGYWNHYYGDHFSGEFKNSTAAYHGPPILNQEFLHEILTYLEPKKISNILNSKAQLDPEFKQFNHRNAWSNEDVIDLFSWFDFDIISCDKYNIINSYADIIPDIEQMGDWSAYFLFENK